MPRFSNSSHRKACGIGLAFALLCSAPLTASAEHVDTGTGWAFTFTAYSWLPWLSGDTAIRGREIEMSVGPSDVLKALDWSGIPVWMSNAELRHGPFTLLNDIVYSKLADSAGFERSFSGRFAAANIKADVDVDFEQTVIELGAAYEVWSSAAAGTPGRSAVEVLGGARYWRQELNVSVDVTASATLQGPLGIVDLSRSGNRVFAKSGSVDWVDPFVGARVLYDVAPGQSAALRGDVGGFGAGSDFTWHVLAVYNWQLCVTDSYKLDAYVGYRALSVDYSEGTGTSRYEYDAVQHGPLFGMTMRF